MDRLVNANSEPENWLTHHKQLDGARYVELNEINKFNVKNLKVAYTIPLGDVSEGADGLGSHQSTPLVKDGYMYVTGMWDVVYKIDLTNQYPNIVFANEFFDCFPVRQFFKKNQTWYEKMIEIKYNESLIKFKDIIINDKKTLKQLNQYKNSEVLEISNSRDKYFDKICKHISKLGGMIIVIDYGYRNRPGYFTLQSVYNNKRSNVLDNIGKQDITSLVDFNKLIDLGKKNNLKIEHFSSQREFLLNNGIKERENKILKVANNKQRIMVQKGVKRIIDKKDMGNLFKVLVLSKWN